MALVLFPSQKFIRPPYKKDCSMYMCNIMAHTHFANAFSVILHTSLVFTSIYRTKL